MKSRIRHWTPAIIGFIAILYYAALSCKTYTWLFASGDSGDWLAASNWWIVPQPFGSPLYISLGHFLNLWLGDLVIKMTLLLSVLPAAITVLLVYLIVKRLTGRERIAITSSAVLLGAAVFLSQATVLEEYSLVVMFVTLGFYFYIQGKWKLTFLSLGLGSAVHIMVVPITALWLMVHFREWQVWRKALPVYIACGVLPYGLILWLMASDTPRLVAGGLSLGAINSYLGSTGVVGTLSIVETPERILHVVSFIVASLGLAIVPSTIGLKKPWSNMTKVMLATIGFSVWYYLTCIDPTTWTFLIFSMPFIAIATGLGLVKMKSYHTHIILAGALCLMIVNSIWLNADRLNREYPIAPKYYQAVQSIPDGSAVVINRGGWEALGFYYAMSEGKELIPVFFIYAENEDDALHKYYVEWMHKEYGVKGYNTQTMAQYALGKGIETYILIPPTLGWDSAFEYTNSLHRFGEVKSVNTSIKVHGKATQGETTEWHPFWQR